VLRALLVLFVGLLTLARAEGAPLLLAPEVDRASLEGRLEHYADPTGEVSLDAVRLQKFVRLPAFRSQGYSNAAHWYRFDLERAPGAPRDWILSIGTLLLDEVDVWVEQPDGGWRPFALGDHRPYEARPLQTRHFAVPLQLSERTRVYLRVRSTGSINVSAELWQPAAFVAEETRANFSQGLYFGILLIVAVFYAILGAWSRDFVLATYAGYVLSLIPLHMGFNGYLPMVLPSSLPWLNDVVWRVGFLGGMLVVTFMWIRLLETRRNFPRVHRLYQATVLLCAALLPFVGTSLYLPFSPIMNLVFMVMAITTPTLLGLLWWRRRSVQLMLYFVAFVVPAVGGAVQNLVAMGGVPTNALTAHAYQFASVIHVVVMSFGLALRVRQMNRDKAAAEQEAVVATQRAEEQRRFVAMLSHEFRNPLAAIDRAAQMIRLKTPAMAPPEAQRLDLIRANASTLAGFVDNFLMTEALDHGALALALERSALRPLLEAAVRAQGDAAGERVRLDVTPDDATFDVDPTLLGVAIGNLLGNALRYSPAESPVELTVQLGSDGLHLRVADRGPGLGHEELARLGMPYYRAASSQGKKGTGLGFHFTQRIVQAHGGTLSARNRTDGGLEVELSLPRQQESRAEQTPGKRTTLS
jgi:signal transduction histidine kinase